jgi:aminoglycoside N3'-acetyltransferase
MPKPRTKIHKAEQQMLFPTKNDPDIVKVADRVIALRKSIEAEQERLEVQELRLLRLLKARSLKGIRHGGKVILVKQTMNEKIVLKPDSGQQKPAPIA